MPYAPPRSRRHARGLTLLETMATAAVLMVGILGVLTVLVAASRQNRRNNNQTQATLIAEQELERIVALRCMGNDAAPCSNIQALDDSVRSVWWSANGEMSEVAPGPGTPLRLQYTVAVDVDPPVEGGEEGSPSLTRIVAGQSLPAGMIVNVRVTVSWQEPSVARRAVALQTRMSR
jgi:Tfp pilus assembly protein PilE